MNRTFMSVFTFVTAIIGASMVFPIIVALVFGEGSVIRAFALPMAGSFAVFAASRLALRGASRRESPSGAINAAGGYTLVAGCWLSASLLGAVPFLISGAIPSPADALFESVSGITTTGATILSDVESLGKALNFYRCQLHWIGGVGIIALTVALLPLLGIGGFQIIKAETTGPDKGKFTAKIADTAKVLYLIYLSLTAAETVLLTLSGMDFTDALSHAFSNVAAGGFSTRNDSIGAFKSSAVNTVTTVFMILAAVNFALYYNLFRGSFASLKKDSELKAYFAIIALSVTLLTLFSKNRFPDLSASFAASLFHTASILSTTGFSAGDYFQGDSRCQAVTFALLCIGGCSGSAAGGVKVVRWIIAVKHIRRQLRSLVSPRRSHPITLNDRETRDDLVYSVGSFFFLYAAFIAFTSFVASLSGADLDSAISTALALLGNAGMGFTQADAGPPLAAYPAPSKLWFCAAMIAGRLELFTLVLVFFRKRAGSLPRIAHPRH